MPLISFYLVKFESHVARFALNVLVYYVGALPSQHIRRTHQQSFLNSSVSRSIISIIFKIFKKPPQIHFNNLPMPLISFYLVKFESHVARFALNVLRVLEFLIFLC